MEENYDKLYETLETASAKAGEWCDTHLARLRQITCSFSARHQNAPLLAKVHCLLAEQPETPPCERSIICNGAQGCSRRNCPARTVAIETYIRRLRRI